ncbi:hypothetical protein PI124_g10773 [Phytophthora idaei]|nr:hypothetical protein PI125_g8431 [Phytophthora idaei]KAG3156604.1 hypothetical protein PI126_g8712 [Phytophthora idaei]KAG3244448.1 hypothetical protein PI124_g10773 [Phytophthora idaei]
MAMRPALTAAEKSSKLTPSLGGRGRRRRGRFLRATNAWKMQGSSLHEEVCLPAINSPQFTRNIAALTWKPPGVSS